MQDSGQIRSLHAQVSSLKDQLSALHSRADTQDSALEAAYEQIAIRDGRVRALEMQLRRAEEDRSDVSSALAARREELRQKDRELADKDAELTTIRASTSSRQQAQQQPQQQSQQQQLQQQHRLQRVSSVASTTHRYELSSNDDDVYYALLFHGYGCTHPSHPKTHPTRMSVLQRLACIRQHACYRTCSYNYYCLVRCCA